MLLNQLAEWKYGKTSKSLYKKLKLAGVQKDVFDEVFVNIQNLFLKDFEAIFKKL